MYPKDTDGMANNVDPDHYLPLCFWFKIILRCMGAPSFSAMFSKGDNFHDFLYAYGPGEQNLPKMEFTLKGKTLLVSEQTV